MIFYLLHQNTSNYRRSTSASNNRKLTVVRSAISQMSQVNVRSAINKEIARSHNFDVISKLFSNSLHSIKNNLINFLHNRVWARNKGQTICSQCSHLISRDESCFNVEFTGFHMNIRLAQLKLFNVWSYDGSNPGEKPPASGAKLE